MLLVLSPSPTLPLRPSIQPVVAPNPAPGLAPAHAPSNFNTLEGLLATAPPTFQTAEEIDIGEVLATVYLDLIVTPTANALARKVVGIYLTREERLPCNMKGTHGHQPLDPLRVAKLKSLFLTALPVNSAPVDAPNPATPILNTLEGLLATAPTFQTAEEIDIGEVLATVYLDLIVTPTANALARKVVGIYLTREERLPCNMKGTHGHQPLDPLRVAKVKSLFLTALPINSAPVDAPNPATPILNTLEGLLATAPTFQTAEEIDIGEVLAPVYLDLIVTPTANALARKVVGIYLTREERLPCNMKGTHGHQPLDPLRVAKVRSLFLHVMGTKAEDQETAWARAVVTIDNETRNLRKKIRKGKKL